MGMTNEEATKNLKKLKSFHNGSYGTAIDMAIKALEQQPNRCDSCIHSEERDGSNCYECIKGMSDNFEEQPKTSYISIDVTKFAKGVAEKALDEITYEGKTIREWAEILVKQQPSEDAISREAMLSLQTEYAEKMGATTFWKLRDDIRALPSVTPQRPKGRWIYKEYDERTGISDSFFCSECGEPRCMKLIKYCPNCGTEMSEADGGGE